MKIGTPVAIRTLCGWIWGRYDGVSEFGRAMASTDRGTRVITDASNVYTHDEWSKVPQTLTG